MAKTVQLLAVIGTRNKEAEAKLAQLTQIAGQPKFFEGHDRTYQPRFDGGVQLPPEPLKVRTTADVILGAAREVMTSQWDLALTVDTANSRAYADVTVDGETLLEDVPVGHLLWLHRELGNLHGLVSRMPVRDESRDWSTTGVESGLAKSEPVEILKRDKVPGKFVLYDATKEHPAQVQRMDTDEVTGTWTQVNYTGAMEPKAREQVLRKISRLMDAVKMAREGANTVNAEDKAEGQKIFDWLGL